MKRSNTKENYLLEALRLFAERGYEAVGVVEIAQAVGCTTSALYKHYAGKQALFDAIVERSRQGFEENMAALRIRFSQESRQELLAMTEADQIRMLRDIYRSVVQEEFPRLFRKLITVEQFKHPELGKILTEHYIDRQLASFEELMRVWIDGGVMRPGDPKMMALQYVSPMVLLMGVCDREPEREEAVLALLEEHIRQFNRAYRIR